MAGEVFHPAIFINILMVFLVWFYSDIKTILMFRFLPLLFIMINSAVLAQPVPGVSITKVDSGWAGNSINTVVFRKNALTTYKDTQFISFYNAKGWVVIGKRKTGTAKWQLKQTKYTGNIKDAHNSISITVDGDGYLHLAWDHHNNQLNYCKSVQPLSLDLTEKTLMTGKNENSISYPEFYKMPSGDLLFLYRDGGSGRGNLVVNKYNIATKQWTQLHDNLIEGEGQRNPYWQACVDERGVVHISWVWRESPDVASNHDMCYARSIDGGLSWEKSTKQKYTLPITMDAAEHAWDIPEQSELINQTSMCTDTNGDPVIASYWRDKGSQVPQYHILYKKAGQWQVKNLLFRTTPFSLGGEGTKQIPISRPQVISWNEGAATAGALIFRDAERNNKISVAISNDIALQDNWKLFDLTSASVGAWEPCYDTELWKSKQIVDLFVQYTAQADAEGLVNMQPQLVSVLEWKPLLKKH